MRTFVISIFALLTLVINASSTSAAVCPPGIQPDIENGKYYYQSVECTPSPESIGTGSVQAPQSLGTGTVKPTVTNIGTNITLANPLKGGGNVQTFLLSILDFVIKLGTIVVILMLVLVGYKFVAAQGEPGKITEARDMLLWTIVGALVLLGSKAIALGIEKTVQALSTG